MGHQIVTRSIFGNKGSELGILDGHFLNSRPLIDDAFNFVCRRARPQAYYSRYFTLVVMRLKPLDHSIVTHLCCVRDKT